MDKSTLCTTTLVTIYSTKARLMLGRICTSLQSLQLSKQDMIGGLQDLNSEVKEKLHYLPLNSACSCARHVTLFTSPDPRNDLFQSAGSIMKSE